MGRPPAEVFRAPGSGRAVAGRGQGTTCGAVTRPASRSRPSQLPKKGAAVRRSAAGQPFSASTGPLHNVQPRGCCLSSKLRQPTVRLFSAAPHATRYAVRATTHGTSWVATGVAAVTAASLPSYNSLVSVLVRDGSLRLRAMEQRRECEDRRKY